MPKKKRRKRNSGPERHYGPGHGLVSPLKYELVPGSGNRTGLVLKRFTSPTDDSPKPPVNDSFIAAWISDDQAVKSVFTINPVDPTGPVAVITICSASCHRRIVRRLFVNLATTKTLLRYDVDQTIKTRDLLRDLLQQRLSKDELNKNGHISNQ